MVHRVAHARLVLWRSCQAIALQGAMYHIFKFYDATCDAIRIWALRHSVGSFVLCALASYVMSRTSSMSVSSWKLSEMTSYSPSPCHQRFSSACTSQTSVQPAEE